MTRVLIFSRIRLYREGLAQILSVAGTLAVAATPSNCGDLQVVLREGAVDVVLLDMSDEEGRAIAAQVRALAPTVPIVGMGIADSDAEVLTCIELGASGFATREASVDDLVIAVQNAARGDLVCSPGTGGALIRRLSALASERTGAVDIVLTRREREVAKLLQQELSNKEIALHLGIEVATVKNHVHSVLEKLNVQRRSQAAVAMRRHDTLRQPA